MSKLLSFHQNSAREHYMLKLQFGVDMRTCVPVTTTDIKIHNEFQDKVWFITRTLWRKPGSEPSLSRTGSSKQDQREFDQHLESLQEISIYKHMAEASSRLKVIENF